MRAEALPNFSSWGYEVTNCLNRNIQGGRLTYKAINRNTQAPVVIKQFRFATQSDWSHYKAIEREIGVLKGLKHPGIPQYLDQFDPGDGLCLVQEYKPAEPLSTPRSYSPEEIKSIARQALEILVYLQGQIPFVVHRDLKPENILLDVQGTVYLVDFGLARVGDNTMAMSSMMGGTFGFMPPEQLHNQKLTKASDLYGLGATLICLVTQTKSMEIGNLMNFGTNRLEFQKRVAVFSLRFVEWLTKLVEPEPTNRFADATTALKTLEPLYVVREPEVKLDQQKLEFIAKRPNEKISRLLTLTNTVPETTLQGKWSVAPHPSDPPHTPERHAWITFSPQKFSGNQERIEITVDTRKLLTAATYKRELVLVNNGKLKEVRFPILVITAAAQNLPGLPPYILLLVTGFVLAVIVGGMMQLVHMVEWFYTVAINGGIAYEIAYEIAGVIISSAIAGAIIGAIIGAVGRAISRTIAGTITGAIAGTIAGAIDGAIRMTIGWEIAEAFFQSVNIIVFLAISKSIINFVERIIENQFYRRGYKDWTIALYLLLTAATGIITGVGAVIGFSPHLLAALGFSAIPLTGMLVYPSIKRRQFLAQQRHRESSERYLP